MNSHLTRWTGTWNWKWTAGNCAGTEVAVATPNCWLVPRAEMSEDMPALMLRSTPQGFLLASADERLEVDGVTGGRHWLTDGACVRHPSFEAVLTCSQWHYGSDSEAVGSCEEGSEPEFPVPSATFSENGAASTNQNSSEEATAAPKAELPEPALRRPPLTPPQTEIKEKLLSAFRGLRQIKHKLPELDGARQTLLMRTVGDISRSLEEVQRWMDSSWEGNLELPNWPTPTEDVVDCQDPTQAVGGEPVSQVFMAAVSEFIQPAFSESSFAVSKPESLATPVAEEAAGELSPSTANDQYSTMSSQIANTDCGLAEAPSVDSHVIPSEVDVTVAPQTWEEPQPQFVAYADSHVANIASESQHRDDQSRNAMNEQEILSLQAIIARVKAETVDVADLLQQPNQRAISDSELLGFDSFGGHSGEKISASDFLKNAVSDVAQAAVSDMVNHSYSEESSVSSQTQYETTPAAALTSWAHNEAPLNFQSSNPFDEQLSSVEESPVPLAEPQIPAIPAEQSLLSSGLDVTGDEVEDDWMSNRHVDSDESLTDANRAEIDMIRARLSKFFGPDSQIKSAVKIHGDAINPPAKPVSFEQSSSMIEYKAAPVAGEIDQPTAASAATESTETTVSSRGSQPASLATAALFPGLLEQMEATPEEAQPASAGTSPAPVYSTPVSEPSTIKTAAEETGDETVSDYMNQLFRRLRGDAGAQAAALAATASSRPPVAEVKPVVETPPVVVEEVVPFKEGEYLPKKTAPERKTDMNALRHLANQSTRQAVSQFVETQKKSLAALRLAGIGGGITLAAMFFTLSERFGDPVSWGGMLSLVGSGAAIVFHLYSLKKEQESERSGPVTEVEGLLDSESQE